VGSTSSSALLPGDRLRAEDRRSIAGVSHNGNRPARPHRLAENEGGGADTQEADPTPLRLGVISSAALAPIVDYIYLFILTAREILVEPVDGIGHVRVGGL
jgi:hypothetical protein